MPARSAEELPLNVGVAVSMRVNNARIIHDITSIIDSWWSPILSKNVKGALCRWLEK